MANAGRKTDPMRIEAYVQMRVQGLSSFEAYRALPGTTTQDKRVLRIGADRMEQHAGARLRELFNQRAELIKKESIPEDIILDRAALMKELFSIARAPLGHEYVKTQDKRAALMDLAKLEGYVIERTEVGRPGDFSKATEEELDAKIAELLAQLGYAPLQTMPRPLTIEGEVSATEIQHMLASPEMTEVTEDPIPTLEELLGDDV